MAKSKFSESETLELKSFFAEKQEILETISAFSNTKGGKIIVGIKPDGNVTGVTLSVNTLENFANEVKTFTDPKVFPTVEIKKINHHDIVEITVPEYPAKPVFVKERVFIRVGRTNQKATADKIRQFIKNSGEYSWDEKIIQQITLKEIDNAKIKVFLKKAENERNILFEGSASALNILRKLKLIEKYKITNAAILLFGKNPQKIFYRSMVKCGRFKGTEAIDFIDMHNLEGTIIEQVTSALNFISRHINIAVKISGDPQREEIWEYPKEALREAIINAVCHRDYEDAGNVQIRIFEDRLEIRNPGELPPGITLESLRKVHSSKPRNDLIAKCFYLIKYIEQWGTGTNRIIRLCREADIPEPEFNIISGCFVVTFYKQKETDRDKQSRTISYPGKNPGPSREQPGTELATSWYRARPHVPPMHPASTPQAPLRLLENSYALSAVKFCTEQRSRKEIQEKLGLSDRKNFNKTILKPVIDNLLIRMVFPDNPRDPRQKYVITEKGKLIIKMLNDNKLKNKYED